MDRQVPMSAKVSISYIIDFRASSYHVPQVHECFVPKCGIRITDWQRRQLILLHVEFREMIRPGEDSVGDAVAEVVLHVQMLQNQTDHVLLESVPQLMLRVLLMC